MKQLGLQLVAWGEGRDIVFAVDVTRSVRLNNEGRLRIEQIIRDNLQPGDTVYIVPFASEAEVDKSIEISNRDTIQKIFNQIPLETDFNRKNTDIQNAELFVYQFLAQQNHCRLIQNQGIREQAVVWLTDAPLATQNPWIETPKGSPFRQPNSQESQLRRKWLETLPLKKQFRKIPTEDEDPYQLTIVDIKPTVQEFCTPTPSEQETCLVNRYLVQQLWFPATGLTVIIILGLAFLRVRSSWQKRWNLKIEMEGQEEEDQDKGVELKGNQRLAIGDYDSSAVDYIECPGEAMRGYIERKGNQLYLVPTKLAPIFYKDQEVKKRIRITEKRLRLSCPHNGQSFEFIIKVEK
jgi:hypothetical protein